MTFDKQSNVRQTLVGSKSNRRCNHYVTITLRRVRCFGVTNPGIKTYTTSLTDSKNNQWMDSGKSWSNKNFVSEYKDNEITLLWTHHETQLYWKGYHPRNLIREEAKGKTKDNMVRQHHSVDRHGLRKSTSSNGQQKLMEKNDPWCSQQSDRGRLSQVKSSLIITGRISCAVTVEEGLDQSYSKDQKSYRE